MSLAPGDELGLYEANWQKQTLLSQLLREPLRCGSSMIVEIESKLGL